MSRGYQGRHQHVKAVYDGPLMDIPAPKPRTRRGRKVAGNVALTVGLAAAVTATVTIVHPYGPPARAYTTPAGWVCQPP
jgi:hypothetical protein